VDIVSDDANSGNDKWYMGFNYKQGGNVAYSLYGEKDGQKGYKCSKKTFINSFYSSDGLTSFATAAGINLSSNYKYTNNKNYRRELANNENNNNRQYNNNQNNVNGGNKNNNMNSYTQGLYCNPVTMQFEEAMFTDKSMNPTYFSSTVDSLTDLNKALSKISCVQIYNRNTGENYASSLLLYSDSCEPSDGTQCPDRYGKLATCEAKFTKNDGYLQASSKKLNAENIRYLIGGLFFVASAITVLVHFKMQRDPTFAASCSKRKKSSSHSFEVDGGGDGERRRRKSSSKKRGYSSRRSKSKRRSKMDEIRSDEYVGTAVPDDERMT